MYRELLPSPQFAGLVECYWTREAANAPASQLILPDGCVDILFRCDHGQAAELMVVGLMTTARETLTPAGTSYFGVRFRPGAAVAFLPEAPELADVIEPLRNDRLFESFALAGTAEARATAFETLLQPKELAPMHSFSERHRRRVCKDRTGISPKQLERILRFRRATELLHGKVPGDWAAFALHAGYYDQSHWIAECKEFSGLTPGRFFQSLQPRTALHSGT